VKKILYIFFEKDLTIDRMLTICWWLRFRCTGGRKQWYDRTP